MALVQGQQEMDTNAAHTSAGLEVLEKTLEPLFKADPNNRNLGLAYLLLLRATSPNVDIDGPEYKLLARFVHVTLCWAQEHTFSLKPEERRRAKMYVDEGRLVNIYLAMFARGAFNEESA
jgi:hypothetical protein